MWQITITIVRIAFVVVAGACLYFSLLKYTGWVMDLRLKRRKSIQREKEISKIKILLIYLIALMTLLILCILMINHWIRGGN